MSIADKLAIIAENEQKVYNAGVEAGKLQGGGASEEQLEAAREEGRQAEWNDFWSTFQNNGNRTNYQQAFRYNWTDSIFKPKYDMHLTTSGANQMFQSASIVDLKGCLERQGVVLDTSNVNALLQMFQSSATKNIPVIDARKSTNNSYTFSSDAIVSIEKLIVSETTPFHSSTFNCKNLEDIVIEGNIGNSVDFKASTKLSKASITSVINALTDNREHLDTISDPTVTLSKTAVENAFHKVDCLTNATFSDSISESGLTITNNGDGSFTINGTYDAGETDYYYFFNAATVDIPFKANGTYILSLEGGDVNGIEDFFAEGGFFLLKGQNDFVEPSGDTVQVKIVICKGATFNNVTVRPTLVYAEWETLIYHISHYWTIALV